MTGTMELQSETSPHDTFILSLSDRLERIEYFWNELQTDDDYDISSFLSAVHYLAGGAGVCGLISMSRRAYEIIALLRPCLEKGVVFTKEKRFMVDSFVSSLFSLKEHYDEVGYEEIGVSNHEDLFNVESSNEIFILEHNPDEELTLKVFLENADLYARSFKSLHKLHRALHNTIPHAVIIDLQQSSQDATAPEFITELQQKTIPYPVVALSDTGDISARLQAARIGATHFFIKPVDGYRLVDMLHKATGINTELSPRVLLVDDDPETSNYVAAHLRKEGLNVHVLNAPLHLLDTMSQFHPDLVLTDLYMPECNGLELATIIRQHQIFFDTPIVFLSSETDDDMRLAALQLGSDDFFSKSIDIDVVAKAIKSRLDRMSSYALVKKAMMWSPN